MPRRFSEDSAVTTDGLSDDQFDQVPVGRDLTQRPTTEGKRGPIVLATAVGVLILGLSIWQLAHNVTEPFQPSEELLAVDLSDILGGDETAQLIDSTDTDGDGLSDAVEQQIYKTSIYLTDSDSDGLSDNQEVQAGKDPLCPEGSQCQNFDYYAESTTETSPFGQVFAFQEQTSQRDNLQDIPLYQLAAQTDIDPTELRQVLLESGFSPSVLEQYGDAELVATFQEAVQGGIDPESLAAAEDIPLEIGQDLTPEQQEAFVAEINAMDGQQLRALLASSGVNPQLLEGKDDELLRQFLFQAIALDTGQVPVNQGANIDPVSN